MSSRSAMARTVAAVVRRKMSSGFSGWLIARVLPPGSGELRLHPGLRQLAAEAALVVLRHDRPLDLVALVEEGDAEGEGDVVEDARVLRPGDHRARRHHGRDVAGDEAGAGEVGERHHRAD